MAEDHTYFVVGFVAQNSVTHDPRFLLMMPGIKLDNTSDGLGQEVSKVILSILSCFH